MGLQLNDTIEPYRESYGSGKKAIPELVADGRVLLSVEGLAERRINSTQPDWRNNYFFLGDAFVYSADGTSFKVVRNSDHISAVDRNTRLVNGAIPLENSVYDALEGEEFVVAENLKYINQDLSPKEQKGNLILASFIPDKALRDEYIDRMSEVMKQNWGYDKVMGVFPANNDSKTAIIRPAFVCRLGGNGSQLSGRAEISNDIARWVGVAPEVLSAPGKAVERPNLETSLRVVNDNLRIAGYELVAFPRKR